MIEQVIFPFQESLDNKSNFILFIIIVFLIFCLVLNTIEKGEHDIKDSF